MNISVWQPLEASTGLQQPVYSLPIGYVHNKEHSVRFPYRCRPCLSICLRVYLFVRLSFQPADFSSMSSAMNKRTLDET